MIQGLRTAVYFTEDLKAATEWYASYLGKKPYYDTPYYVGFEVEGYEFGLHPKEPGGEGQAHNGVGGVVAYWGVEDIDGEVAKLLGMGAKIFHAITEVGEGIKIASVIDPWGNEFGLIYNPHFKASN